MPKKSSLKTSKVKSRSSAEVAPRQSRKLSTQRKVWLHPDNDISSFQVKRRFAIGLTFVTVLAFIYFITSERDFFDVRAKNVSVLGEHSNTTKGSVAKQKPIEKNAKEKPVALLKFHQNNEVRHLPVDANGYVMHYSDAQKASDTSVTIVAHIPKQLPEPDTPVNSEGVQLALRVLRTAQRSTPDIAAKMRTIDANQPEKIILQLDGDLPVMWLSSDLVEIGLNNIELFLKKRPNIVKKKKQNRRKTYLDARFTDAIYLGRIN